MLLAIPMTFGLIGVAKQFVPWFFVTRLTFIYHYFPCVIFVALMIGYSFRSLKESLPKNVYVTVIALYALLTFGAFLLFYPVLAGQPVEIGFVTKYLRWFKDWIFVAS